MYISASCIIDKNVVLKNNHVLFENNAPNVADFLLSCYRHFNITYPKFHKMDNLSKLGWLANEVLLKDQDSIEQYNKEDVGILLTNANASLDTDIKYFETTKEIASPALFVYTLPNIMIGEICIKHKFKGENAFFIFENFNADFIYQYVKNSIDNNILQTCICGWVELLGEQYKTVLFLIEKNSGNSSIAFTTENITKIYSSTNG